MAQEHTIANFLTANLNGAFPLDTEGLAALQGNLALLHALGRMSGCACVLSGCANRGDAGLVFWYDPQRNSDFPDGEVLPVKASPGNPSDTLHLVEKPVSVTVAGQTIMNAYTERHLEWGTGSVSLNYDDFRKLDAKSMTLQGLHDRMTSAEATIETLKPLPIGSVIMWAGTQAPTNYLVCDGNFYSVLEYPLLAQQLANIYQKDTPREGMFQVPDFRSRMPVGRDTDNTQGTDLFNHLGDYGGEVMHKLTEAEMPKHNHGILGHWGSKQNGQPDSLVYNGRSWTSGNPGTDGGTHWRSYFCAVAGGDGWHNNMPPFMTINYIIRAK
ncbi:MAG: tail fiber protein [Paludibacteraceae bacterium]|nr:tail fiber protein [Paludibacteraceae bacterium]MBP3512690.1 tail fiber protein [Prevotella sp.]